VIHSPYGGFFFKTPMAYRGHLQKINEKRSQALDDLSLVHKKNKTPIACALFTFKNPKS
jgi:hypothetical protein